MATTVRDVIEDPIPILDNATGNIAYGQAANKLRDAITQLNYGGPAAEIDVTVAVPFLTSFDVEKV